MKIKIDKIPGGFQAAVDDLNIQGVGTTWPEAIGHMLSTNARMFNVTRIEFRNTPVTGEYRIQHGLNQVVWDERTSL